MDTEVKGSYRYDADGWVIVGVDAGRPAFWSNTLGWVTDRESADVFQTTEGVRLPTSEITARFFPASVRSTDDLGTDFLDDVARSTSQPLRTKLCTGTLGLLKTESVLQGPCEATKDGNICVSDGYKEDLIDVLESRPYCYECGALNAADFERHGLSEDWEEV